MLECTSIHFQGRQAPSTKQTFHRPRTKPELASAGLQDNVCTAGLRCELRDSDTDENGSYSEACDSLYERTMFAARRTQSIRELPRMLPASLQCVRVLQLSTAFQYPVNLSPTTSSAMRPPLDDTAQWTETCRVLASFARLSTLDITLALWPLNPSRRDTPISVDSFAALLDPLRTVRADRFTVTVTSNVPPDVRARLLQVPFELQIRDRPGIGYYTASSDD